jgi:outer membrane protein assembly factor BamB
VVVSKSSRYLLIGAVLAVVAGVGSVTVVALMAPRPRAGAPAPLVETAAPAKTPGAAPAAPAAAAPAPPATPAASPRPGAPARAAAPAPKPAQPVAAAGDWPQWRGPDRTGVSREAGLLKSWPAAGPALAWKAAGLGGGYSTPSVAGGRIYGMGAREEQEVVWALDEKTGKEVWSTVIVPANRQVGYSEGPRSTPTVDGDRLYALGVSGDLVCLDLGSGKLRWRKNLVNDFGGSVPNWGYAESPLIDGEKVIATPGGGTATLVALNKLTGDLIWKAQVPSPNGAHYASAIAADVHGVRQYIQFTGGGLVGVAAQDGRFLWKYDRHANLTANIGTPIFRDNCVLISAAYGSGAGLVKLDPAPDGTFTATEVYFNSQLKNKHGGMVLVGDYVYGFDDPGTLTCMEFKTGRTVWQDRSVGGNASVTFADGHLYCRSQRGTVALVVATPDGYQEHGRFEQPDRSTANAWPHPVVAHGKLYLRDQDILLCYDVR